MSTRQFTFITFMLLVSVVSYASQRAITDTGEEVILNSDGTWKLSNDNKNISSKIVINKNIYKKPKESSFLLKSTKNNSAYWINTKKWTFKKSADYSETEYVLQLKGKDLYAMTITEEIEIELKELINIAISNAKEAAPDVKVVSKEYRTVNGKKVIHMQMKGTIQSIKFTYLGYYYSDKSGSTQLVVYTATNLVEKYKSDIFDLLNGLATK